jgi:thiol-disulfide isomerase/thioredoxin
MIRLYRRLLNLSSVRRAYGGPFDNPDPPRERSQMLPPQTRGAQHAPQQHGPPTDFVTSSGARTHPPPPPLSSSSKRAASKTAPAGPALPFVGFDLTSSSDLPKLIDQSATVPTILIALTKWDEPSIGFLALLDNLAQVPANTNRIRIASFDAEELPEIGDALRIESVPTVFAFFQGRVLQKFVGVPDAKQVEQLVTQLVALVPSEETLDAQATLNGIYQTMHDKQYEKVLLFRCTRC